MHDSLTREEYAALRDPALQHAPDCDLDDDCSCHVATATNATRPATPPRHPSPHPGETWRNVAACRGHPTELFFPPGGHPDRSDRSALAICHTCPARLPCLNYAIVTGQDHGIWGGTTERQRARIRRSTLTIQPTEQ